MSTQAIGSHLLADEGHREERGQVVGTDRLPGAWMKVGLQGHGQVRHDVEPGLRHLSGWEVPAHRMNSFLAACLPAEHARPGAGQRTVPKRPPPRRSPLGMKSLSRCYIEACSLIALLKIPHCWPSSWRGHRDACTGARWPSSARWGLTGAQARVIRFLEGVGHPVRMADIAAALEVVPRTATSIVDGLEADGLVARAIDPHGPPLDPRSRSPARVRACSIGSRPAGDGPRRRPSAPFPRKSAASSFACSRRCAVPAAGRRAGAHPGRHHRRTTTITGTRREGR